MRERNCANTGEEKPGRFFAAKQLFLFAVMTVAVLLVDFLLLCGISAAELMNNHAWDGDNSQHSYVRVSDLAECLAQNEDGSWSIADGKTTSKESIEQNLDAAGCWGAVLNPDGTVAWTYHVPSGFPSSFTQNQIAVMSHDREFEGATAFIWTKDPYLVVLGYPHNQYTSFGLTVEQEALYRIPLYVLMFFLVDLAIIFLLYTISQRSVAKTIGPTLHALDNLAEGKPVQVRFRGILRPIGTRINQVSRTLEHKETARKNWIAGVSHDVRTPLAVVMGHAERLEHDGALPAAQQKTAGIIVTQSIRIRDLVEDLNIATQLEYDMQPLKISTISLPRLMRETAASYLNQNLNGNAEITLSIDEDAEKASLEGDERLIRRALSNALNNALKHNRYECTVDLGLSVARGCICLTVSDNGHGMAPEKLADLAHMLQEDYLEAGLLAEFDETHFTFAPKGSFDAKLPNAEASAPGAPAAPLPYAKATCYPASYEAPTIKPLRHSKKKGPTPPPLTPSGKPAKLPAADKEGSEAPSGSENGKTRSTIGQHGLGMPLIARIALVHGGTFTVKSAEGKGFCMEMSFPLQQAQ